jgi:hypothetical protein
MTKLSAAAQAVYDAAMNTPEHAPYEHDIVAVLRAVADQVAPCEECPGRPLNPNALEMLQFQDRFSRWHQASLIQQQIYAIANELEGAGATGVVPL